MRRLWRWGVVFTLLGAFALPAHADPILMFLLGFAKNVIERKIKEAFLALWLETRLTKDEILKLYLDRAYMGGGAFGAAAAAQTAGGKAVVKMKPGA